MRRPAAQQPLFTVPVDIRRLRDEELAVLEAIDKLGTVTVRDAGRIVYRIQNRRTPVDVDHLISAGWRVIKRLRAHGLVARNRDGSWRRPETREAWIANAARSHFGFCNTCGRDRDEQGKRLVVVRVEHGRLFRCYDCAHPGQVAA